MPPQVGNLESSFIVRRNSRLSYFVRCQIPKLGRDIKVSSVHWKRDGVERRAIVIRHGGSNLVKIAQSSPVMAKLRVVRIDVC